MPDRPPQVQASKMVMQLLLGTLVTNAAVQLCKAPLWCLWTKIWDVIAELEEGQHCAITECGCHHCPTQLTAVSWTCL